MVVCSFLFLEADGWSSASLTYRSRPAQLLSSSRLLLLGGCALTSGRAYPCLCVAC